MNAHRHLDTAELLKAARQIDITTYSTYDSADWKTAQNTHSNHISCTYP